MPETIAREERVAEEPRGVFGHDQRDRMRLPARERARCAVGHVVQLGDRPLHRFERRRAHRRRAVHDARDRRSRDARRRGDLFDRDACSRRGLDAHVSAPLGCYPASGSRRSRSSARSAMIRAYSRPLSLTDALLRVVVDADDAEALLVAPRPLEVVEHRPVEVAAHIDARVDRVEDRAEVPAQELDALVVVHARRRRPRRRGSSS